MAVLGFYSGDELMEHLGEWLETAKLPEEPTDKRRMCGLLFFRPESAFAKEQIVPHLEYFHQRSGQMFIFFCAGYKINGGRAQPDSFRESVFNSLRAQFEATTTWKYSGGADLLLLDAFVHPVLGPRFDLSSVIVCSLEHQLVSTEIESVEGFFEKISQFVEAHRPAHPTWAFSDHLGLHNATKAIGRWFLSLLPVALSKFFSQSRGFSSRNITRKNLSEDERYFKVKGRMLLGVDDLEIRKIKNKFMNGLNSKHDNNDQ